MLVGVFLVKRLQGHSKRSFFRLCDEPEPRPGVEPMKSKGSFGHPDSCKAPKWNQWSVGSWCHGISDDWIWLIHSKQTIRFMWCWNEYDTGVHLLFLQCCWMPKWCGLLLLSWIPPKDGTHPQQCIFTSKFRNAERIEVRFLHWMEPGRTARRIDASCGPCRLATLTNMRQMSRDA